MADTVSLMLAKDSDIATLSARVARLEEALQAMLREHDILSGNYGEVMDQKHISPDRWPTTAAMARAALSEQEAR